MAFCGRKIPQRRFTFPNSPRERKRRMKHGRDPVTVREFLWIDYAYWRWVKAARAQRDLDELAEFLELKANLRRFYLQGGRLR